MTSYEETWLCQWHYLPNSHFSRKNCDFQWIFGVPQDFHPHVATEQDLAPHSSELVPTTRHIIPWKTELVPWDSHQSPIANFYQVVYSSRMRTVGAQLGLYILISSIIIFINHNSSKWLSTMPCINQKRFGFIDHCDEYDRITLPSGYD